jgi:hypothetical protein
MYALLVVLCDRTGSQGKNVLQNQVFLLSYVLSLKRVLQSRDVWEETNLMSRRYLSGYSSISRFMFVEIGGTGDEEDVHGFDDGT